MKNTTKKMAFIAIFAAVNFVTFSYGKIDIPLAAGTNIAIHVANAIVVVSSLLLGPIEGGLAGGIGLAIADLLDPKYVVSAPKTFILKFLIGFIAGTVAKKMKLQAANDLECHRIVIISSIAGLGFNVLANPVVSYIYQKYILRVGSDAAKIIIGWTSGVTLFNAVICVFVAYILYMSLRKPFNSIYRK